VDFAPGESQQAVARVAAGLLRRDGPPGSVSGNMQEPPDNSVLWTKLGQAGLLSLALPAWLGGDGLGMLDIAAALTEVGRQAAAVPALATLVLGVLPVVRWGDRGQQQALLAGVASGDKLLTAAVREPSDPRPAAPATTAKLSEGGGGAGVVSGVKIGVPYGAAAAWILVPASIAAGGTGVVIVDPSADGVSLARTHASGAEPEYTLRLDEVPVTGLLGGCMSSAANSSAANSGAVADLYQLADAGACCLADGALAAALELTTSYVASREQFGRPLASFQAVAQQIAEVYIAARTLHLATLSSCWRLDTGRAAGPDLDVAAYWLAQEAPAALRTCQHLHGGIGMDITYPLHRFSALVKDLVRFVGGADYRLDRLAADGGNRVP
jgi:alkylation response protein AidB-like acyl-CoA dehydrogenase